MEEELYFIYETIYQRQGSLEMWMHTDMAIYLDWTQLM